MRTTGLHANWSDAAGLSACSVRDRIDAVRYEDSLLEFTEASWPVVEPMAFKPNWHIEAICDHLEAAANREIDRLLINVPPRHMKSLGANVFFPAWVWAQDQNPENEPGYTFNVRRNSWRGPGVKFMHLSYDGSLSARDAVKCRQIITSPWYQRLWGHRFRLRDDQNQRMRFENSCGGHRLSTSEGGVITGEGADIIVFDDPHNIRDISGASSLARETTLQFWDEALPSRLNDQQHGVFIVIMQRMHEHDLSGHILEKELGWTHLCLPAVYEPDHPYPIRTSVRRRTRNEIWTDPRVEGEVLWPEKFSRETLNRMAKDESMTSHMAAGQLQQRPTAREGGLFKRHWFGTVKFVDETQLRTCRAWDLAATTESGDYTVGVKMGIDDQTGAIYVLNVVRGRWSPAEIETLIKSAAGIDGEHCIIRLPQDPGQAGKFQALHFVKMLQGYDVRCEREEGAKPSRANPFAAQCEHDFVRLVRADWNQALIDELCAFPKGATMIKSMRYRQRSAR